MLDYVSGLSEAEKVRYSARLRVNSVEFGDPYSVRTGEWALTSRRWPPVTIVKITLYLIFTPSRYTSETLEAYKSLEAYNYFTSGKHSSSVAPINGMSDAAGASQSRFQARR